MKKGLAIAAGVTAIAAVVAAVIVSGGGGLEGRLRQRVIEELQGRLGGEVTLGRVRVEGTRDVTLEQLRWVPDGGPIGELTVVELRLAVDAATLLEGEARIEGVTAVEPVIQLAARLPASPGIAAAAEAEPSGDDSLARALQRVVEIGEAPLSGRPAELVARALELLDHDGVYTIEGATVRGFPGGLALHDLTGVVLITAGEALFLDLTGTASTGGTGTLRATLAPGQPLDGRLDLEDLPADMLASPLPRPGGVQITGGTVDLSLSAGVDETTGHPRWGIGLTVDGATVRLPQFPDLSWPLSMRHAMLVTPRTEAQRLAIDDWRWTVNDVPGTGSVIVVKLDDQPEVRVVLSLDDVPYQDLIDALPRGAVPDEWGLMLGGTLDLTLRFGGPLGDRSAWDLGWKGDWSRLQLYPGNIGQRVAALRDPFHYSIDRGDDAPVQRVMGPQDPHFIALDLIHPDLPAAVVVCEDAAFYKHAGFDVQELRQALLENVREGEGRGGSTITQQVVKNLFLSGERTWTRKLREALLTAYLERLLDKRRILEIYLNFAELGPGVYGVRDAAHHYFGTSTRQLSTMECVFLATLLPSPVRYHDYYHPGGAVTSRWDEHMHLVLDRMHSQGYLTDPAYDTARLQTIHFAACTGAEP